MPATKFVCPHCEKPAEVQVTSVTRSRECPHCGQAVLLQVGAKNTKSKRKALLVGNQPPAEPTPKAAPKATKKARPPPGAGETPPLAPAIVAPEAPANPPPRSEAKVITGSVPLSHLGITGPAYEPKALEGEVFERMKMDPELQAHRRNLFAGIAVVISFIVLAIIMNFTGSDEAPVAAPQPRLVEPTQKPSPITEEPPKLPSNTIALRTLDQAKASAATPESKKLTFSPAEQGTQAAAATTTTATNSAQAPSANAMLSRPILSERKPTQQAVPMRPNLAAAPTGNTTPTLSRTRPLMRPRVNGAVPAPLELSVAAKTVAAFLNAPSLNARLRLTANAPLVEETMRTYYTTHVDGPTPFVEIMSSAESEFSTHQSSHTVLLKDGSIREVCVVHGKDDSYLVDWPSLVIYSEMDWSEFMATKVNQGKIFRVIAEFDNYFTNYFADSDSLRCIKITNPLSPAAPVIYAYAEKQSTVGRELDHWIQSNAGKPIKLTVRLKYPTNADASNQVWLTDLISAGWAAPAQATGRGNVGLR